MSVSQLSGDEGQMTALERVEAIAIAMGLIHDGEDVGQWEGPTEELPHDEINEASLDSAA